jgi:hypothetical protein
MDLKNWKRRPQEDRKDRGSDRARVEICIALCGICLHLLSSQAINKFDYYLSALFADGGSNIREKCCFGTLTGYLPQEAPPPPLSFSLLDVISWRIFLFPISYHGAKYISSSLLY